MPPPRSGLPSAGIRFFDFGPRFKKHWGFEPEALCYEYNSSLTWDLRAHFGAGAGLWAAPTPEPRNLRTTMQVLGLTRVGLICNSFEAAGLPRLSDLRPLAPTAFDK